MPVGKRWPQVIKKGKGTPLAISVKKEIPKEKPSRSGASKVKQDDNDKNKIRDMEEDNEEHEIIDTSFGKIKKGKIK